MTVYDGRALAWTAAWQRLESATAYRVEVGKSKLNPAEREEAMREYGYLLREATIYAQLTSVEAAVGFTTGGWLAEQSEQIAERERIAREDFADLLGRRKPKEETDAQD